MLKLGRVTKVKVLFLVLVFVFNFDLFKFSAAILEKGLLADGEIWRKEGTDRRISIPIFIPIQYFPLHQFVNLGFELKKVKK